MALFVCSHTHARSLSLSHTHTHTLSLSCAIIHSLNYACIISISNFINLLFLKFFFSIGISFIMAEVVNILTTIVKYIVKNNFYLIDVTGNRTSWGVWNPKEINHECVIYIYVCMYVCIYICVCVCNLILLHFFLLFFLFSTFFLTILFSSLPSSFVSV